MFSDFCLLVHGVNELNRAAVGFHEYSVRQSAGGDENPRPPLQLHGIKKSLFSVLL